MSEEEQIERMRRNQERLANRKKAPVSAPSGQGEGAEARDEVRSIIKQHHRLIHCLTLIDRYVFYWIIWVSPQAPFPLRVTRVVTAVLPSTLVARRVSVEDPPAELSNPLPEQIQQEAQQRPPAQARKVFSKPPRHLLPESPNPTGPTAKMLNASGPPRDPGSEVSSKEPQPGTARAEFRHQAAVTNGSLKSDVVVREKLRIDLERTQCTNVRLQTIRCL